MVQINWVLIRKALMHTVLIKVVLLTTEGASQPDANHCGSHSPGFDSDGPGRWQSLQVQVKQSPQEEEEGHINEHVRGLDDKVKALEKKVDSQFKSVEDERASLKAEGAELKERISQQNDRLENTVSRSEHEDLEARLEKMEANIKANMEKLEARLAQLVDRKDGQAQATPQVVGNIGGLDGTASGAPAWVIHTVDGKQVRVAKGSVTDLICQHDGSLSGRVERVEYGMVNIANHVMDLKDARVKMSTVSKKLEAAVLDDIGPTKATTFELDKSPTASELCDQFTQEVASEGQS